MDWQTESSAKCDGTVCQLLFRDGMGTYMDSGEYFLHDDGFWYRIAPPTRITATVVRWRPHPMTDIGIDE